MSPAAPSSRPSTSPSTNEVRLRGRVTRAPVTRELPSGDRLVSARLSVRRDTPRASTPRRPATDWVDCVGWTARARRSLSAWEVGDVVEVEGALRRRFLRGGQTPGTLVEVEVRSARRVRRAGSR